MVVTFPKFVRMGGTPRSEVSIRKEARTRYDNLQLLKHTDQPRGDERGEKGSVQAIGTTNEDDDTVSL